MVPQKFFKEFQQTWIFLWFYYWKLNPLAPYDTLDRSQYWLTFKQQFLEKCNNKQYFDRDLIESIIDKLSNDIQVDRFCTCGSLGISVQSLWKLGIPEIETTQNYSKPPTVEPQTFFKKFKKYWTFLWFFYRKSNPFVHSTDLTSSTNISKTERVNGTLTGTSLSNGTLFERLYLKFMEILEYQKLNFSISLGLKRSKDLYSARFKQPSFQIHQPPYISFSLCKCIF